MEHYSFIAYDIWDTLAQRCASWIADRVGNSAVMPQQCWTLGHWKHFLEHIVSRVERIIVVLTPGFLTTGEPFVQHLRTLVLQEPFSVEEHQGRSRLLVVLAEDCDSLLHDELVFYRVQDWVDYRTILDAEEVCQQRLLGALYAAQTSVQGSGVP